MTPHEYDNWSSYEAKVDGMFIYLQFWVEDGSLCDLTIGRLEREGDKAWLSWTGEGELEIGLNPKYNHMMAQRLYQLGLENESIWRDLDVIFSAHETLELRLSMPREFWPKAWSDEEGT